MGEYGGCREAARCGDSLEGEFGGRGPGGEVAVRPPVAKPAAGGGQPRRLLHVKSRRHGVESQNWLSSRGVRRRRSAGGGDAQVARDGRWCIETER